MSAPVITLLAADQTTPVSEWHPGTVRAGTDSGILEVNVWNNKGGKTAVSDLIDASVAVKDGNGTDTGVVPANLWVQALVDSTAAVDPKTSQKVYTAIGGTTVCPLRGQSVAATVGDVIKGTANDGTAANATDNFCNTKFKVALPINSVAGQQQFKIRFQGYYV